ncbi:MAG: VWA domain-containing protein [Pirellulales bacterium]|nr:VWA domain-containing protein [Pirellulales bacterium]
MSFCLRFLVFLIIDIVAVASFAWADTLHIQLGGIPASVLLLLGTIFLWVTRTRTTGHQKFRESPLREALVGAFMGAVWTGMLLLYFFVAARLPGTHAFFLDGNRASVEYSVRLLEERANHLEAAEICLAELANLHTADYTLSLATRAVRNLTLAAERFPAQAGELLNRAIRVAQQYGVSADYPRSVLAALAALIQQKKLAGEIAAAQTQLKTTDARRQEGERELAAAQEKLKTTEARRQDGERELAAAQAKLKTTDARREDAERLLASHERQSAAALHAAIATRLQSVIAVVRATLADDLTTVGQLLEDVMRVAADKQVSTVDAAKVVTEVRAAIASRQPQALPIGARARLLRFLPSAMPGLLIADMQVTDAAGNPMASLRSVDFVARQDGRICTLAARPLAGEGTLELALALDRSDSMQGEKHHSMKAACVEMLQKLPSEVSLRVTTFGTDVRTVADWGTKRDVAIVGCQRLQTGGATALFAAIAEALRSLADRPGQRHIVVFSDGANSVPGPSPASLIDEARRRQISIHFIALTSGNDDLTDVKAIATKTGGRVLVVGDARDLTVSFRQVADELTANCHRLAILDVAPSQPLEIQIGGLNSVQVVVPPQIAQRTVAQ